jgi:hypothetical protein
MKLFEEMKLKRRELLAGFLGGLVLCVTGSVGCAVAAMTWIQIGLSLLATLLPTLPGIIAGFAKLVGKTLTAAQLAKIQTIFSNIANILMQVEAAIQSFEQNPVGSVLTEIKNLLNSLVATLNIQSILNDLGITDPATVAKLTSIINVILGLATDILNILPATTISADGTLHIAPSKKNAALAASLTPSAIAAKLNAAIWVKTVNPEVDAIFEQIKAVPVTVQK